MSFVASIALGVLSLLCLAYFYAIRNDRALTTLPPEAKALSPNRWTTEEIEATFERMRKNAITIEDRLPPKTGRRYIVVGGAGFLGGWIVVHLLKRGEDPKQIRVLDIRAPTREDLTTGNARDVDFQIVDITDAKALNAAFSAPWPQTQSTGPSDDSTEITVIHTAANIRFFERVKWLVHLSAKVNVEGTWNIINACKEAGVSTLIYTSSASIWVGRTRFWLWPWEKEPKQYVRVFNDKTPSFKHHGQHWCNYAYTKAIAEDLVRKANGSPSGKGVLRTGSLRPGNGIFGSGGDILCGAYLVRKVTPSFLHNVLQSFIYVENCSIAHLCYEQRLIELSKGSSNPDIGGQAFAITDPGPAITYGDSYKAMNELTKGETSFPYMSPTALLLASHLIETYYLTRERLLLSPSPLRLLGKFMPALRGDIANLQPCIFYSGIIHIVIDDSRAQLPPSQGGLGYQGPWTTLEGLCKLVDEHIKSGGKAEARQMIGIGFGSGSGAGMVKAQHGVGTVAENAGIIKQVSQ